MKLIIDENISFAAEAFSQFGEIHLLHGRKISNQILKDADVLIVRSITNVNSPLLDSTPVKFVGTATIGTDHVDLNYLQKKNIAFSDAKGCNSDAVAEYVFTATANISKKNNIDLPGKTIGVVGTGNIGSRVVRIAKSFGMNVLKNDPPLQRTTGSKDFVSLNEILKADIITLHVPLNSTGIDKTVHLFDEDFLSQIKEGTILINASRGQVVDNAALTEIIQNKNLSVVLDVWENEPAISSALLEKINIGTPHIAGYSLEGKVNGTKIIYNALCNFFGEEKKWQPKLSKVEDDTIDFNNTGNITTDSETIFNSIYNISRDDKELRKLLWLEEKERGNYFDLLRKNYPLRREFSNYEISLKNQNDKLESILKSLRFKI